MARRVAGVLLTEGNDIKGETFEEGETLSSAQHDAAQKHRDEDDDILRALQQLEGAANAKWAVWRTLPVEDEGLECVLATSQLDLEYLQKRLGKGTYQIKGTRANGTYLKHVTLKIARGVPVDQPGTMVVNGGLSPEYLDFLSSQRGAGKSFEAFKAFALAFGPMLAPVLVELVRGWMSPRKENSLADMVGALEGLKRLSGSTPAPDPLKDIGKLRDLIGAVRDLAPEPAATTGSSVWDLVRDGLKEAAPLITQVLAARQGQPPQPQQQPQSAAAQPQGQERNVPDIRQILASQLPALIAKARNDSNPELYAALIIDNLPPNVDLAPLVALLNDPGYFTILRTAHDGVTPYEGWFDELRKSLLEQLSEEGGADLPADPGEDGPEQEQELSTQPRRGRPS